MRVIVTIGLLFISVFTFAQRMVSGKVLDDKGAALVGASVSLKDTEQGTMTDENGMYSLEVPNNEAILVFSYIGFNTKELRVGDQSELNLMMESDQKLLDEVVVVGYGTQQKRNITGNIGSVRGDELANLPVQSFDQALQGKVAGVNVSIPNGVLNNPPVFRIRGINSINLSSYPLIVLDGVPTFTGDLSSNSAANNILSNINPNDIESIDILKDAAAAAIYGSRAAAGVVIITTKKGKSGASKISYDAWASWTKATKFPKLLNAAQFVEIKNEASRNAGLTDQFFLDTLNGTPVDTKWSDYIYRTGFSHNHNLNFSGGTDKTTYYLSLNYTNQQGMIVANEFNRKSARLNLEHKINKFLKLGGIVTYTNNFNKAPNTGSLNGQAFNSSGIARIAFNLAPIVPAYKEDGSYNINAANQTGQRKNKVGLQWQNPLPLLELNNFTSEAEQIQANVFGQVDIIKNLYYRTQFGIDNTGIENISFESPVHGDGFAVGGRATNGFIKYRRWTLQNIINYDLNLDKLLPNSSLGVLVGLEEQGTKTDGWGASRTGIADPFFTTYQGNFTNIVPSLNFQTENYLFSQFGRVNLGISKALLVTFNLRSDEYSAFADGRKKGTFWGVSAGFTPTELSFFNNLRIKNSLNYFRIRGSYGQVGNNQGIGDFASLSLFNSGLYGTNPTFFYSQAGNQLLTWETSDKLDLGVNFGILNDRINGEITYFKNDISGLILNVQQAPSKGIPGGVIATNVGSMVNSGMEFVLSANVLNKKNFVWKSSINLTLQKNEITALSKADEKIYNTTSSLEQTNINAVGQSIGSLFVVRTDGVNPENGRRVFINKDGKRVQYNHVVATGQSRWTYVEDGSAAPAVTLLNDGVIMGPTLPTYYGAWTNNFSAFGFDLGVVLQYSGGNYIYNGSKAGMRDMRVWNNHTDVLSRWQKPGDVTSIPKVVWTDNVSNGSALQISENVEKGDFVRIREISIGYSIGKNLLQKAGISNARVYLTANNVALFTDYSGTDPEVSTNGNSNSTPGIDRNTAPMAKSFLVGLSVGF